MILVIILSLYSMLSHHKPSRIVVDVVVLMTRHSYY